MSPSAPFLPVISPAARGKESDPPPSHAQLQALFVHRQSRLPVERGGFMRPELWPESGGSVEKDLRIARAYLQLSRDNIINYLQAKEPERYECPWGPDKCQEIKQLYEERGSSTRNYSISMHNQAVEAAEAEENDQEAPPADEIMLQEAQTAIIEVEGAEEVTGSTGQGEDGSQGGQGVESVKI